MTQVEASLSAAVQPLVPGLTQAAGVYGPRELFAALPGKVPGGEPEKSFWDLAQSVDSGVDDPYEPGVKTTAKDAHSKRMAEVRGFDGLRGTDDIERVKAAMPKISAGVAKLLAGRSFADSAAAVTTDVVKQARIAAAMERYAPDDTDPLSASQVAYARTAKVVKMLGQSDKDVEFKELWNQLVREPETMDDKTLEILHTSVRAVEDFIQRVNPSLEFGDGSVRVTKVTIEDDGPKAFVETTGTKALVDILASVPLSVAKLAKSYADASLGFLVDSSGKSSVVGSITQANADKLRNLYPEELTPGQAQWVPSHVRPVKSIDDARAQFSDDAHVLETYDNAGLIEFGGHPAMVPGTHLVVEALPEVLKAVKQAMAGAGVVVRLEGAHIEEPAAVEDVEELWAERAERRAVKLAVSGAAEDVLSAAEQAGALGATGHQLYLYGDAPEGWTPATVTLYSDGYRTLSHVTRNASIDSPNSFRVYLRSDDASGLSPTPDPANQARRDVETIKRENEQAVLVNGEVRVLGAEVKAAKSVAGWRVDGQRVRQVGIDLGADLPTLAPNQSRALTASFRGDSVVLDLPADDDVLPAFRALDVLRRVGVDVKEAVLRVDGKVLVRKPF